MFSSQALLNSLNQDKTQITPTNQQLTVHLLQFIKKAEKKNYQEESKRLLDLEINFHLNDIEYNTYIFIFC